MRALGEQFERVAQLKTETDKLEALLEANTDLTRQDKADRAGRTDP